MKRVAPTEKSISPYWETVYRNRKILFFSGLIFLAALAFSVPLRCVLPSISVGGASLLCGMGLGLSLAGITRTRRIGMIYLFLVLALLMFVPLFGNIPFASPDLLTLSPRMPALFENYFDFLRWIAFFCGFPYPFAQFGFHASDLPSAPEVSG